eukprot:333374-Chlamydomonas_euryale.AAC.2
MATVTRHASVAPHADATLHASKQGLSRWTRMSVSCRLSCARALFFIHTGMPAWGCCRPSRAACRRLVLAVFLLPQNLPKNCGWVTLYRRKIRLSAPRPCSAAPDRRAPRRPRDHGAGSGAQPWACPGAGERVPCLAAFEPGRWPNVRGPPPTPPHPCPSGGRKGRGGGGGASCPMYNTHATARVPASGPAAGHVPGPGVGARPDDRGVEFVWLDFGCSWDGVFEGGVMGRTCQAVALRARAHVRTHARVDARPHS